MKLDYTNVPATINKKRIRRANDGSLFIANPNAKDLKDMDKLFIRIKGYKKWMPHIETEMTDEVMLNIFQGKGCYIVGKGPSLDNLNASYFPEDWPIIAINEAIYKVEGLVNNRLFCMHLDRFKITTDAHPITIYEHYTAFEDLSKAYLFSRYSIKGSFLSALYAIQICKKFKTSEFNMLCFDAAVNKKLTYAKCTNAKAEQGGKVTRFLKHAKQIRESLRFVPHTFTIPLVDSIEISETSSD